MSRILFLGIVAFVTGAALADETNEIIDEVTVMGVRDLGALRTGLTRAEDEVYDLYNELNDDDDYDIVCKPEARIGSQIKRRVCLARAYRDALAEATEDDDAGLMIGNSLLDEKKHNKVLREKMADAANKNPQLMMALKNRYAIEQKFNQERQKRFGNDEN
jgi:hypothetical protein